MPTMIMVVAVVVVMEAVRDKSCFLHSKFRYVDIFSVGLATMLTIGYSLAPLGVLATPLSGNS